MSFSSCINENNDQERLFFYFLKLIWRYAIYSQLPNLCNKTLLNQRNEWFGVKFISYFFTFLPFLLHFLHIAKISSLLLIFFWQRCVSFHFPRSKRLYSSLASLLPCCFPFIPLALFVSLFFDGLNMGQECILFIFSLE